MKIHLLAICLIPLLSMTCYPKEGPDCHKNIYYRNNSDHTILMARLAKDTTGKCLVIFEYELKAGAEEIRHENRCHESWFQSHPEEMLMLSPEHIGLWDEQKFNCDSLNKYFKILGRIVVNKEVLQQKNFVIAYPE